jgi:DNA recombination protein RmuC
MTMMSMSVESTIGLLIGFLAACLFCLGILFWRLSRRGEPSAALGGKISLLSENQTQLAQIISQQLQAQERNLSQHLSTRLGELLQKMAVFDSAQAKVVDLTAEIGSLQKILGNSKSRGLFGEVQLQNLLEAALPPNAYALQTTLPGGLRPDCLLQLPNPPGPMVVDAKFPLDAYRQMLDAKTDDERNMARKSFDRSLRARIDEIAGKYIIPGITADSALLFLPSDAIFADLHTQFEGVLEYSYRAKVWIVSPTTMMATLNTIRAIMRDVKLRTEAAAIQNEVRLLCEDLGRLGERMDKANQAVGNAQKALGDLAISVDKISKRGEKIMAVELAETPPAEVAIERIRVVGS